MKALEKLGFKLLEDDAAATEALIRRAYELLLDLRAGKLGTFIVADEEARILDQIVLPPPAPRRVDVEAAYDTLVAARKLIQMQVPALVSAPVSGKLRKKGLSTDELAKEIERFRARVLLVCLDLAERDYQAHIANKAALAARQLIRGQQPDLLAKLPSFDADMATVADSLSALQED